MNKRIGIMSLALCMALGMEAQTIYEGVNIAKKDLNGTARFVGMGGAMSALGGDLSTIGTNPAGIGVFRSNDASVSFGLSSYATESSYLGNKSNADKVRGDFNSAGFVIATKIGNATTLRYVNFGFNYLRAKSFYHNMQMGGNLNSFSQTFAMAGQASGITNWKDAYSNVDIGWLSALAYDGYLISDVISQSGLDDILKQEPGFTQYEKMEYTDEQGVTQPVRNLDGELLYRIPGVYSGMWDNGVADFRSRERGGVDQYDFNLSFNLSDRIYLGLTVGAYTVDYEKESLYGEDYGNGERYNLRSWNKIDGAGFDLKFGTIIRPFEYSPFRIGFSVHTPIFYNLDFKTGARMESDIVNFLNVPNELKVPSGAVGQYTIDTNDQVGEMVREFQFRTPWTYNVSLGYTVDRYLALGAEYEYQDYSSMKFRDTDGYSEAFQYENNTTSMLKGVHTFRMGLEYKVIPQFAMRAGYNIQTSAFTKESFKDLPINSVQTDTDFANSESLSNYTLGIGYRGKSFYADLTYKYTTYKSDFYPFDMNIDGQLQQATKVTDNRSQVLFTLGMRF